MVVLKDFLYIRGFAGGALSLPVVWATRSDSDRFRLGSIIGIGRPDWLMWPVLAIPGGAQSYGFLAYF